MNRACYPAFLLLLAACAKEEAAPAPAGWPVAEFSLTNRDGSTVTLADLQGKVWLASFVYTRCEYPCPMMTAEFQDLQEEFPDDDLRFVTFTVDPEYDTPEVLSRYAKMYEAGPRWLFLTGPLEDVLKVQLSMKLGYGPAGPKLQHSVRFVLVGRDGKVIRTYLNPWISQRGAEEVVIETETADRDALDKLREELRHVLAARA